MTDDEHKEKFDLAHRKLLAAHFKSKEAELQMLEHIKHLANVEKNRYARCFFERDLPAERSKYKTPNLEMCALYGSTDIAYPANNNRPGTDQAGLWREDEAKKKHPTQVKKRGI